MHHLSKVVGVTAITLALTTLSGCQTLKNSKLLGGKDEVVATKLKKASKATTKRLLTTSKKVILPKRLAS